jgi:hypothetical protein
MVSTPAEIMTNASYPFGLQIQQELMGFAYTLAEKFHIPS